MYIKKSFVGGQDEKKTFILTDFFQIGIQLFVMYSFLVEFNPLKLFSVAKKVLNVQPYQLPIITNSY